MYVNLSNFVVALCLLSSGCLCSENAINVILGGSWFSKSTIGTSGNYLMADWREKNLHTIGDKDGPESLGEHGDSQRPSLDDTGLGSLEQFANCGHLLQDFEKLQKTELVNKLIFRNTVE